MAAAAAAPPAQNQPAAPAAAAPPAGGAPAPGQRTLSGSLYVGDLPTDLTNPESVLYDLFSKVGMVVSVKVCRDVNTQRSLGYAYVNFQNPADAERALETMNYHPLRPGRQIRIMWSQRDPNTRKLGSSNIFIKNLDASIDNRALCDTFSVFGNILSCKVAIDDTGASKGYGFVHFETDNAASEAIARIDGMLLNGKAVNVCPFLKYQERVQQHEKTFTNVFLKNLDPEVTEDKVKELAAKVGTASSIFLSAHEQHATKFGLINFENHEHAATFIENYNGKEVEGVSKGEAGLFVCRALKKRDREHQIKVAKIGAQNEKLLQSQGRNIYVKHLDETVSEDTLKELFSQFGTITSAALNKDANGGSRGFGFVCFSTKEAAQAAIRDMNGKMVYRRPLYVALAQQKDQRIQMLEEQRKAFANRQMFMQGGPMNFGWGYPPYMMGGGGRGGPPMPPMGGPMGPGMMGPGGMGRGGMGRGGMGMGRGGPPRGPIYPNANKGMPPPMPPQQRYTQPMPPPQRPPPQQMQAVTGITAMELSNMAPDEQKNALGERLYAKIQVERPQQAAKITGMLLEMDTTEILNVLEDPNVLRNKIEEAVAVLKQHEQ